MRNYSFRGYSHLEIKLNKFVEGQSESAVIIFHEAVFVFFFKVTFIFGSITFWRRRNVFVSALSLGIPVVTTSIRTLFLVLILLLLLLETFGRCF